MYKAKRFLAIIPARGGSKGIHKKNIVVVNGKHLIQYTIDEAKKSKYIDKILVSTDDEEIGNISIKCGAEVPFLRPKELAQDDTKTIYSIIYTIKKLKEIGHEYDYVIVLQPTQPLRKSFHIDESIEKIVECNEDNLVSISPVTEHPILMKTIKEDGNLQNLLGNSSDVRRQDFQQVYKVNGAIYINKINSKFNNSVSLNDNKLPYIMDKKYDLDIDENVDLDIFKFKFSLQE